jgi:hypothetical protein
MTFEYLYHREQKKKKKGRKSDVEKPKASQQRYFSNFSTGGTNHASRREHNFFSC